MKTAVSSPFHCPRAGPMADFAAPTPEDDQQPAASAETSAGATAFEAIVHDSPSAAEPDQGATTQQSEAAEPAPTAQQPVAELVEAEPKPEPVVEPEPTATGASMPSEPVATEPQPPVVAEATAIAPEAAPAVAPTVIIAPSDAPSIATTIEVPASAPADANGDGGEWELLVEKLTTWIRSGQLQQQWQTARTPLSLLAGLIAVLLVLRIYNALLAVIEGLPLLPGLLELVGVIAVVRFSVTRLVRTEERQQLIQGLQQRWKSFRGQG